MAEIINTLINTGSSILMETVNCLTNNAMPSFKHQVVIIRGVDDVIYDWIKIMV